MLVNIYLSNYINKKILHTRKATVFVEFKSVIYVFMIFCFGRVLSYIPVIFSSPGPPDMLLVTSDDTLCVDESTNNYGFK